MPTVLIQVTHLDDEHGEISRELEFKTKSVEGWTNDRVVIKMTTKKYWEIYKFMEVYGPGRQEIGYALPIRLFFNGEASDYYTIPSSWIAASHPGMAGKGE